MKNNQSKSVTKLLASSTGLDALMRLGEAMPKSRPSLNLNLRPIEKIGQDGVDHINTSSEASHMLGKIFSLHHPMGFHDPITDRDVKSLYHWNNFISDASLNPRLLTSNNTKAYTRGDKLAAYLPLLLAWGVYQKVTQNQDIMQVIKDIRVPFDCYITLETRTRTHSCRSYIAALQIVQRAVLRATFPQLWRLLPPEDAHQVDGKSNEDRFKAVISIIYGLLESAIKKQEPVEPINTEVVGLSEESKTIVSSSHQPTMQGLEGGFLPGETEVIGTGVLESVDGYPVSVLRGSDAAPNSSTQHDDASDGAATSQKNAEAMQEPSAQIIEQMHEVAEQAGRDLPPLENVVQGV